MGVGINCVYLFLIVPEVFHLIVPSPQHVSYVKLLPDPLQFLQRGNKISESAIRNDPLRTYSFIWSVRLDHLVNSSIYKLLWYQLGFFAGWSSLVFLEQHIQMLFTSRGAIFLK